jgi:hypothetical protein
LLPGPHFTNASNTSSLVPTFYAISVSYIATTVPSENGCEIMVIDTWLMNKAYDIVKTIDIVVLRSD